MAIAVVLLITVFLSLNWYYYKRTKKNLDDEFSERLRAIASLVSSKVELPVTSLLDTAEERAELPDTTRAILYRLSEEYELSNILIMREDGVTLFTLRPDLYRPGEPYPHWRMDYPAIIRALEGYPTATDLYRASSGAFLKAGYSPVPPAAASAKAVVAVEASVDFLHGLNDLRTILFAATAIYVVGIALFTWFVFKATTSLIRARESLMQSETLASMGRMAAGIAHEIRNPLFIIRSSAEKLRSKHPQDAEEINSFIIEETDRLNVILTDYLLFAKNEPMQRQPFDLVTTLRRSIDLVRDHIEKDGIELVTAFEIDRAPFTGEEKRIQQCFLNVLINAQQSIENGGQIKVSITSKTKHYIIRFEDTGTGIPEKDLENIFEPFFTTKPTGSGLGLAIVKKEIEEHDGKVEVESKLEVGTRLIMILPKPNDIEKVEPAGI